MDALVERVPNDDNDISTCNLSENARYARELLMRIPDSTVQDLQAMHEAGLTREHVLSTPWVLRQVCAASSRRMVEYLRNAMGIGIADFKEVYGFTYAASGDNVAVLRYFAEDEYYGVTKKEVYAALYIACKTGNVSVLAYLYREFDSDLRVTLRDLFASNGMYAAVVQGRLGIVEYAHDTMHMDDEGFLEGVVDGSSDDIYMNLVRTACESGHPTMVRYLVSMSDLLPGDFRPLVEALQESGDVGEECIGELTDSRMTKGTAM